MSARRVRVALVVASLIACPALAQGLQHEESIVVPLTTTRLSFDDVNVEGVRAVPNDSYVLVRKKTRFRNLIELRGDFRPELARSSSSL